MYKLMVVTKNSPLQYMTQYKEESLAKAAYQNIHDRRKEWLESRDDSISSMTGDDYGTIDLLTSEIVAVMLTFSAEGVQLMPGIGGRA